VDSNATHAVSHKVSTHIGQVPLLYQHDNHLPHCFKEEQHQKMGIKNCFNRLQSCRQEYALD
jgi:hypothetical protein